MREDRRLLNDFNLRMTLSRKFVMYKTYRLHIALLFRKKINPAQRITVNGVVLIVLGGLSGIDSHTNATVRNQYIFWHFAEFCCNVRISNSP